MDGVFPVVQGIGRHVWKWSFNFDADLRVVGQAMTKAEAISRAERAIDRALAAKKLRLVSGRDQTNFGCRFRCYDRCFYYYARYFAGPLGHRLAPLYQPLLLNEFLQVSHCFDSAFHVPYRCSNNR
jgi:hypothetical protein